LYYNNSMTFDSAPVYAAAYMIQYSPILLCPAQDGNTNYTSAGGRQYTVICGGYYDGGIDSGNAATSSLAGCIALCEGRNGCTGVVWSYGNEAEQPPGTANNNGGCYFKTYGSAPIAQRRAGSQQAAAFVPGSSVPAISSSTVSEDLSPISPISQIMRAEPC
jgi:hypothetical protein